MTSESTANTKKEKTGILKKYLDNTFGEEGLRTDVKITLTNETLAKLIGGGVILSILATLASYYTRKILEQLHK